jgi:hypothetical protein
MKKGGLGWPPNRVVLPDPLRLLTAYFEGDLAVRRRKAQFAPNAPGRLFYISRGEN